MRRFHVDTPGCQRQLKEYQKIRASSLMKTRPWSNLVSGKIWCVRSASGRKPQRLSYNSGNIKTVNAIRIAVTQLDGTEKHEVIHFERDEERLIKDLQEEIASLICKNKKLGLAAASRAIWAQLKSVEEGS